jgi:hypothetical protein
MSALVPCSRTASSAWSFSSVSFASSTRGISVVCHVLPMAFGPVGLLCRPPRRETITATPSLSW